MTSFIATKYILPVRQGNYTLDSPILGSERDNTLVYMMHHNNKQMPIKVQGIVSL